MRCIHELQHCLVTSDLFLMLGLVWFMVFNATFNNISWQLPFFGTYRTRSYALK